jgi:hypothetical protein
LFKGEKVVRIFETCRRHRHCLTSYKLLSWLTFEKKWKWKKIWILYSVFQNRYDEKVNFLILNLDSSLNSTLIFNFLTFFFVLTTKVLLNRRERDEKLSRILDAFVDMTSNRTLTFFHFILSHSRESEFLHNNINSLSADVWYVWCYKSMNSKLIIIMLAFFSHPLFYVHSFLVLFIDIMMTKKNST